jgi:hypothetical protein
LEPSLEGIINAQLTKVEKAGVGESLPVEGLASDSNIIVMPQILP